MEALLEARDVEERDKKKEAAKESDAGQRDATCMPIIDSFESLDNKYKPLVES
ncbi:MULTISPECIES: hypothetical protein [Variovorax]|uniref:Uncharacterized protein n=1 Tax=Variovorax guangxiensis TaxID=1775474 RepID=A0A840FPW3_9BURK|nr:hypothetical protein [Variovorax guangxiensis]MBB4224626.1 hypothetical protein [Variovorax guangxiensis]